MRYKSEQRDEAFIIEQHQRANRPLPKSILEAPRLMLGLDFYMNAFYDLTTCRYSQGGPRPHSEIARWCDDNGIVGLEFERFATIIRSLDNEMLSISNKKK